MVNVRVESSDEERADEEGGQLAPRRETASTRIDQQENMLDLLEALAKVSRGASSVAPQAGRDSVREAGVEDGLSSSLSFPRIEEPPVQPRVPVPNNGVDAVKTGENGDNPSSPRGLGAREGMLRETGWGIEWVSSQRPYTIDNTPKPLSDASAYIRGCRSTPVHVRRLKLMEALQMTPVRVTVLW